MPPTNVSIEVNPNDRKVFLIWKEHMVCLIIVYGVEGYNKGETLEPKWFLDGSTKSNHEHALWSRINGVAKRWIFSSVSGLMIGNVPRKKHKL